REGIPAGFSGVGLRAGCLGDQQVEAQVGGLGDGQFGGKAIRGLAGGRLAPARVDHDLAGLVDGLDDRLCPAGGVEFGLGGRALGGGGLVAGELFAGGGHAAAQFLAGAQFLGLGAQPGAFLFAGGGVGGGGGEVGAGG